MASTMVLLHGFTQTGASWAPVVAGLGERYRPLAPDIRGHGSAGEKRPITMGVCVRDVAQAAPERFALAGYSMGGRLALEVAVALPDRVERLALIGATAGIEDPAERARRREEDERLAREIEASPIDAVARRWAEQPVLARQPPAVRAAAHADRLRNTPSGLAAALRGIGTGVMTPLWDRLGELPMPVTVLAGERDAKFVAIAERLVAAIPRPELVVVPGAGHAAHLEAPEFVARTLAP
jgi:2-succinyl-6-hydroxy-2,4-cyclohexadiene-1-carboxylate synthase